MSHADLAIIGAGIVGLATAWTLLRRRPGSRVIVLEKEREIAQHQSGRNSGVIHSGLYYRPGSLKAVNCRRGKAMLEQFCREHDVPFEICGKVIVATHEAERARLEDLLERGRANGVSCEFIDHDRLRDLEPHAAGIAALHVPEAGIVDFAAVCRKLMELIEQGGGSIRTDSRVVGLCEKPDAVEIRTVQDVIRASRVINCAGLYADRIARLGGDDPPERIVPFRGEFYELRPEARGLCRNLIYPVPDPSVPFLGVHVTRTMSGAVECGPNAVLALAREGYSWGSVRLDDVAEMLRFPGSWRFARRYWRTGLEEFRRSLSKRAFVRALQRLVPQIEEEDVVPGRTGVRAQALTLEGQLVDDFLIRRHGRMISVINAPSPAATSCLSIAETLCGEVGAVQEQSTGSQ